MKGALHKQARSNGSAGGVTRRHLMRAVLAGEAAPSILYLHCAASRHHSSNLVVYASSPPQREDGTPVHACLFQGSALTAWRSTAMMIADGRGTPMRTAWAWAASARARPPLASKHCDPQPSAAAHRQLLTSPPGITGRGHVVRGTQWTAEPRKASIGTATAFTCDKRDGYYVAG